MGLFDKKLTREGHLLDRAQASVAKLGPMTLLFSALIFFPAFAQAGPQERPGWSQSLASFCRNFFRPPAPAANLEPQNSWSTLSEPERRRQAREAYERFLPNRKDSVPMKRSRGLSEESPLGGSTYESVLGGGLVHDLKSLQDDEVWLNIGTGRGQAIVEFLSDPRFRPNTRVISVDLDQNSRNVQRLQEDNPQRVQIIAGLNAEDLVPTNFPRVTLATDVFSSMSYSLEPERILRNVVGTLRVGGRFRFNFAYGEIEGLREWIASMRGVRVDYQPGKHRFTIERIREDFHIPDLEFQRLVPQTNSTSGDPPARLFRYRASGG